MDKALAVGGNSFFFFVQATHPMLFVTIGVHQHLSFRRSGHRQNTKRFHGSSWTSTKR